VLTVYTSGGRDTRQGEARARLAPTIPDDAVWIDLLEPTDEEKHAVEAACGIDVPTHEEMQEIEVSSRLYEENGAIFATIAVMSSVDSIKPRSTPVTLILAGKRLITLRYIDPIPFGNFSTHAARNLHMLSSGEMATVGLLDAIIDRIADILEMVGADVDSLSWDVFDQRPKSRPMRTRGRDFRDVMFRIGRNGDITSKARESLMTIDRAVIFLSQALDASASKELRSRRKTLSRDIQSLNDHAAFLAQKVAFLLDATLGVLGIEQNNIIKMFSVAAVAFLPPTLIASIYGMNFRFMPELDWPWGYPLAIAGMIVSAILPLVYFKRRGWL